MKIGIVGCSGRMGKAITSQMKQDGECHVSSGIVRQGSDSLGKDIGTLAGLEKLDLQTQSHVDDSFRKSDAIIDFSTPETTLEILASLTSHKPVYVLGTTGFSSAQIEQLHQHSKKIPIIWSANMSIGVNLLLGLTEQVSAILGDDFDIEIIESHHRQKVDAPSGTALALGQAAARGRTVELEHVGCKSRDGIIGARKRGEIGFSTIRGGDIVGEHTVMFAGLGERIELRHIATDRTIFAKGAIKAAKWGVKHAINPGLYTMRDVLF